MPKVTGLTASKNIEVGTFIKAYKLDDPTKFKIYQIGVCDGLSVPSLCLIDSCIGKVGIKTVSDNGKPVTDMDVFIECLSLFFGAEKSYEILDSINFGN